MDIFLTIVFGITGLVSGYFSVAAWHDMMSGKAGSAGIILSAIFVGTLVIFIISFIILGGIWLW